MINNKIINFVDTLFKELKIDKEDRDYIGTIVYGSYIGQRNTILSDLDVMIIRSNYDTQDIGSIPVNNIRIEYFVQDIKRLYELVNKEIENNDPSHLTKFATCEILEDKDGRVEEFIKYARTLYNTKILPSFGDDEKFLIFSINNRIEDLESLIDNESFYAVYYIILEMIRKLYAKINGIIDLPVTKTERIYTDRTFAQKYISSPIHDLPEQVKDFVNQYLEYLKINDRSIMLNNIKNLYNYSFGQLDFNPNNFCLKYIKKPPFKV